MKWNKIKTNNHSHKLIIFLFIKKTIFVKLIPSIGQSISAFTPMMITVVGDRNG